MTGERTNARVTTALSSRASTTWRDVTLSDVPSAEASSGLDASAIGPMRTLTQPREPLPVSRCPARVAVGFRNPTEAVRALAWTALARRRWTRDRWTDLPSCG